VERNVELIGGPRTTVHYPRGWGQASNTPFRLYKSDTFGGGIRAPFIVHWPAGGLRDTRPDDDGIRRQFVYVTDVPQTILDLINLPRSSHRHNLPAADPDGASAAAIVRDPAAQVRHSTQYTETGGNRGYFRDRWKIVTNHRPGAEFDDTEWELYDLAQDPTETRNLAPDHPDLVRELAAAWEREAWHNTVFPLDDRSPASALRRPSDERFAAPVTLYPKTVTLERYRSAQLIAHRDFRIVIPLRHRPGDTGVLVAHGDQGGGYLVLVDDVDPALASGSGTGVRFTLNAYGVLHRTDPLPIPPGDQEVVVTVRARPGFRWNVVLAVGDRHNELADVPQLLGMAPFTGISVGADKGGPVDWDLSRRYGSHPYRGDLQFVRYEPGPLSPDSPAELARLWAEAARIYD
jgi:arylsulfatase